MKHFLKRLRQWKNGRGDNLGHARRHAPRAPPPERVSHKKAWPAVVFGGVLCMMLVSILGLMVLVAPRFVGLAFFGGEESVFDITKEGSQLTVHVNPGLSEVVGLYFELRATSPESFDICSEEITIEHSLGWGFAFQDCRAGVFSYGIAGLNPSTFLRSEQLIRMTRATLPEALTVELSAVDMHTRSGVDVFNEGTSTFSLGRVIEPPVVEPPVVLEVSGGGGGGGGSLPAAASSSSGQSYTCTRRWECGVWSSCRSENPGSSGYQQRACHDEAQCQPTITTKGKTYPVIIFGEEKPEEKRACQGERGDQLAVHSPLVQQPSGIPATVQQLLVAMFMNKIVWFSFLISTFVFSAAAAALLGVHLWKKRHVSSNAYSNNDELQEWIVQQRKLGYADHVLMSVVLTRTHWSAEEVRDAFAQLEKGHLEKG